MHGTICKALEGYLATTHGAACWDEVRRAADLAADGFEALDIYPDATFRAALGAAARCLDRPEGAVLEDVGAWLCTHPPLEPVRRLLRFCGPSFPSFLFSLEEVEARGRMALPDLALPGCHVRPDLGGRRFVLRTRWSVPGAGALMAGVVRVMASDHGTLAVIACRKAVADGDGWRQDVLVDLVREAFHPPRHFALARSP
jgi:hypothetical protein